MNKSENKLYRNSLYLILGLSLFELLLHLYTNAFASYGYFRDELYYAACSNHLAAGYVDQPPLSIYILFISINLFGKSLFALRLVPAFAAALVVFFTGLITRRMKGGYTAIAISCISVIFIPMFLGTGTFYSMNILDWLFWVTAFYIIVLIIEAPPGKNKLWPLLGLVLGLGLLNKIDILWLGLSLFVGLLLTPQRVSLKTRCPYMAALIAFLIFSPYIIWNFTHNFATLEFIHNASSMKYSSQNPWTLINDTFMSLNPITSIVWVAGLIYLFFNKDGRVYRLAGFMFLTTFLVLIINWHSKAEYFAPAFPVLYAAGGVMIEKITRHRGFSWARYAVPSIIGLTGIIFAPLALPILPVEAYISYSKILGQKPSSVESQKLNELPQFYADMFGWENLAASVSKVYTSLPPEEQKKTIVFGQNYGEAGAIDFFRDKYPLPSVASGHNNYWLWGYGDTTRTNIIVIGGTVEDHLNWCRYTKKVGEAKNKYAMPYESNLLICLCKDLKYPYSYFWKEIRFFI